MKMLREDNSGFVIFPIEGKLFTKLETGKTMIYLVAFDSSDISGEPYILSNTNITMPGNFLSDDITQRPKSKAKDLDELIKQQVKHNQYDRLYFPNTIENEKQLSISLTSVICIGWSDWTFEYRDISAPWNCTFRDLTNEGRKLYYSIKKLHNNKEVRILTFNNI